MPSDMQGYSKPSRGLADAQKARTFTLLRIAALLFAIYIASLFLRLPTEPDYRIYDEDLAFLSDDEARMVLEMHLSSFDPMAYNKVASRSWRPFLNAIWSIIYSVGSWIFYLSITIVFVIPAAWILNNKFWPKQWLGRLPELPHQYIGFVELVCRGLHSAVLRLYNLAKTMVFESIVKITVDVVYAIVFLHARITSVYRPIDLAIQSLLNRAYRRYILIIHSHRAGLVREYIRPFQTGILGWFVGFVLWCALFNAIVLSYQNIGTVFDRSVTNDRTIVTRTLQALPTKTTSGWFATSYTISGPGQAPSEESWYGLPKPTVTDFNGASSARRHQRKASHDPVWFESAWEAARGTSRETEEQEIRPLSSSASSPVSLSSASLSSSSPSSVSSLPPPLSEPMPVPSLREHPAPSDDHKLVPPTSHDQKVPSTTPPVLSSFENAKFHNALPNLDSRDPLVGVDIVDLTLAEIAELSGPMRLAPTGAYKKEVLADHAHAYCDLCKQRHGVEVLMAQKDFLYDWQTWK